MNALPLKRTLLLLVGLSLVTDAEAQLRVDITRGVRDPVPIAIVPFAGTAPVTATTSVGAGPGSVVDVARVIQADLERSGRFRGLARELMPAQPTTAGAVEAARWRTAGSDYAVVGRLQIAAAGQTRIEFDLLNLLTGQVLLQDSVTAPTTTLRLGAHRVADKVFERITGVKGAFATRIAYISVDGQPPAQRYQLIVADADGENARVSMESRQPIMSPAWSADGQWLAYVSFESRAATIFVQRVRTGERRQVSARVGVNGAPAFSPDGSKLALTLSGSGGNLDIYVLDLGTQQLTRLTEDPAIDTESSWAPDGRLLYFTSDRGGAPQIYAIAPEAGARARRVTFGSGYAARPRVSPDGKQLAVVTQEGGGFRIGVAEIASGQISTLSRGSLDESPSFAPNGAMLIYAGREQGQGVLATVSTDGLVAQRLKSDRGEVREPVWGPFVP